MFEIKSIYYGGKEMNYLNMSVEELREEQSKLLFKYTDAKEKKLSLDLSRGKPGKEQIDLMTDMLTCLSDPADCISSNGMDCRNYGVLDGIPEMKALFSELLNIPAKNILLSTGSAKQKADMLDAAKLLSEKGYSLYATGGTSKYLTENGIQNTRVYWPSEEGQEPQALKMLHNKEIDMVVIEVASCLQIAEQYLIVGDGQ